MTNEQLRKRAEKLIREGRMPTLSEVCEAVLEARRKYALLIRRAQREAKERK